MIFFLSTQPAGLPRHTERGLHTNAFSMKKKKIKDLFSNRIHLSYLQQFPSPPIGCQVKLLENSVAINLLNKSKGKGDRQNIS